jgi:hypothetical protein
MFWSYFSYDKKGPTHCWTLETVVDKKLAEKEIDEMNQELEPLLREEWELQNGMRRLVLRTLPGPKPEWKFNAKTGKLKRGSKGGIDWYLYQKKILLPKLIPFAKECLVDRPGTLVQEDKAPSHTYYVQARVYNLHNVQRLLWCGNSPDLNAIEPV